MFFRYDRWSFQERIEMYIHIMNQVSNDKQLNQHGVFKIAEISLSPCILPACSSNILETKFETNNHVFY